MAQFGVDQPPSDRRAPDPPVARRARTPHGVTVSMPPPGARRPYVRLTYYLNGRRVQTTFGRSWAAAWAEAVRIDAQLTRG